MWQSPPHTQSSDNLLLAMLLQSPACGRCVQVSLHALKLELSHSCHSSVTTVPAALVLTHGRGSGMGKGVWPTRQFPRSSGSNLILLVLVLKPFDNVIPVSVSVRKAQCPQGCHKRKLDSHTVCVLLELLEKVSGEAFESSMGSVRFTALAQRVVCGCTFAASGPLIFLICKTEIIVLSHPPRVSGFLTFV